VKFRLVVMCALECQRREAFIATSCQILAQLYVSTLLTSSPSPRPSSLREQSVFNLTLQKQLWITMADKQRGRDGMLSSPITHANVTTPI